MPTSRKAALEASIDRLRQDNLELQNRIEELERELSNTQILFVNALGAIDKIKAAIIQVTPGWTPTSDGSGRDPESF